MPYQMRVVPAAPDPLRKGDPSAIWKSVASSKSCRDQLDSKINDAQSSLAMEGSLDQVPLSIADSQTPQRKHLSSFALISKRHRQETNQHLIIAE